MKYLNLFIFFFCFIMTCYGQNVPNGITYQGTAYNTNGSPIQQEEILVQIQLYNKNSENNDRSRFIENHKTITNDLGIFKIIIGSGSALQSQYDEVAWSEEDVWIDVKLDFDQNEIFDIEISEQLFAVPYAIHANTASQLIQDDNSSSRNSDTYWRTSGNKGTDEIRNFIGTLDNRDFVFRTNNTERMRINSSGEVNIENANVNNVNINNGQIGQSLRINDGSNLIVDGESVYNGNVLMNNTLKVMSTFSLNGEFYSKKSGYFHKNFEVGQNFKVGGISEFVGLANFRNGIKVEGLTTLDELLVENNATVEKNLTVNKYGIFNDQLTVQGQTTLNDPLVVNDVSYLNNYLYVKRDASNGNYIATFENTNNEKGDGIKIRLGKNRPVEPSEDLPIYTGPLKTVLSATNSVIDKIMNNDTLEFTEVFTEFFNPSQLFNNHTTFLYASCYLSQSVGNSIITTVNNTLGLPWNGRDILVGINGYDPKDEDGCFPYCSVGDWFVPDFYMEDAIHPDGNDWIPRIPTVDLCDNLPIDIPQIPAFPDLSLNTSSLSTENNFILFTDQNDNQVGAITGISKNELATTYLDELLVLDIAAEIVGLDPLDMAAQGANQVAQLIDKFNTLGVEYTSGHGDYAEWLPRETKEEVISTGDIVAVKGGKITKDLTGAEQIMAVSHRPIVLGNVPQKELEHTGNNVAFMGQIPVKVMGPIESGDYIVGLNDGSGYGKGYSEEEMTLDLIKNTVGRSWDTNLKDGPKLVNTVVGVSSKEYIKFLTKIEKKLITTQSKLDELSVTVDNLSKLINHKQFND